MRRSVLIKLNTNVIIYLIYNKGERQSNEAVRSDSMKEVKTFAAEAHDGFRRAVREVQENAANNPDMLMRLEFNGVTLTINPPLKQGKEAELEIDAIQDQYEKILQEMRLRSRHQR